MSKLSLKIDKIELKGQVDFKILKIKLNSHLIS